MPADRALLLLCTAFSIGTGLLLGVGVVGAEGLDEVRLDSDGDGLADADEDSNHNHRVDHGETDPYDRDTDGDGTDDGTERRTGTDPAHNGLLDFPEPMVFDMVRGLGAEKGEVEVNTLVLVPTSPVAAWWAPEIEAATRLIAEF